MKNENILQTLSNQQLRRETIMASRNEKSTTIVLLEHLVEMDHRRLYARLGFCSLWEFVHKELRYSEAQASDRVAAARLLAKVPEVKSELETGSQTLTTIAKIGHHVRREKLSAEDAKRLVEEVSGKSTREVEEVLVSQSTVLQQSDRIRLIAPGLTRITIDVDQEFMDLVQDIKNIKGNPGLSFQDAFRFAMLEYIKKRNPPQGTGSLLKRAPLRRKLVLRAPEVKMPPRSKSRYIPENLKLVVKVRAKYECEYVSPLTGRKCGSKAALQIDHIVPFSKGGLNTLENLRCYCRTHNLLAAIDQFGEKKIEEHLKKKT